MIENKISTNEIFFFDLIKSHHRMKIRSGFRSSIKSGISEKEREKKIEKKGERKGKRKTKRKSGRGVTMKKKKNKADDSRQL